MDSALSRNCSRRAKQRQANRPTLHKSRPAVEFLESRESPTSLVIDNLVTLRAIDGPALTAPAPLFRTESNPSTGTLTQSVSGLTADVFGGQTTRIDLNAGGDHQSRSSDDAVPTVGGVETGVPSSSGATGSAAGTLTNHGPVVGSPRAPQSSFGTGADNRGAVAAGANAPLVQISGSVPQAAPGSPNAGASPAHAATGANAHAASSGHSSTRSINSHAAPAPTGPFTPGNLVVLRAGDGTPYNGTAPLYLDEFTTGGTLVQTADNIPSTLPVGGPGNQPITIDLSAAAGNGQLNRSYDGSVLTFGGVDANPGNPTATGSADRVVAIAGNDPTAANFIDTTTHGQFYVGDDNRGAVALTANGPIWTVGHPNQAGGAVSQGVHYFPAPGPSLGTQVSNQANIRGATIGFDKRLYYSTAGSTSAGLAGIYTEAQALPTLPNPISDIKVAPALFSASKLGGIYLADVNGTGVLSDGDRLYFLDDGTVGGAGTGGLYVSTFNHTYPGIPGLTTWSTPVRVGEGIITSEPTAQLRGLTGTVISPTETDLYVTQFDNVAGNSSYVFKFTDTGTGANIARASEVGNIATITLPSDPSIPFNFAAGQSVAIDGVGTGTGTFATTGGYNGTFTITSVDPATKSFTYVDTNVDGTGLADVFNQGGVDAAATRSTVTSLADGSVTIGGSNYAAQGLRGVAFAPVAPTSVALTVNGAPDVTAVPPGTSDVLTATLSNAQVTPTGVVTFIDQNTKTVLGQGAIQSQIVSFTITTGGSGYSNPVVTISDPTGTGATATATVDPGTGAITDIQIVTPGSGYTNPTVTITDATGTGATAQAAVGYVATLATTLVGNHFVSAYYAGGGPAALASAASNVVQVLEAGSTPSATSLSTDFAAAAVGRQITLTATVSDASGSGLSPTGTVSFFNGTADFSNLIGTSTLSTSGPIASVGVTAGGSGYSNPVVTISDPTGTGATATATVDPGTGAITDIQIVTPGSGYTNPTVTITDATGTGATAQAAVGFLSTLVTSFANVGEQDLIAIYNGDDTFAASFGISSVTTAANATAMITSSANNRPVGDPDPAYTVTIMGNSTLGVPAGTVQFYFDGALLGAVQTLDAAGTASIGSPRLTAGSHFITVAYTATGAANPYSSFTLDTTTSKNGVAFIETAKQAFAPGNLVAVQRGDGTVNLGSSGYLVFLDEYTTAGALVQKIALPNVGDGTNHALLLSGQNGAEGLLNLSTDGTALTLAGYDVPVGQQFVTSTFPFQFSRSVAVIDGSATVDTTTAISTTMSSSVPYNPLDVVSTNGTDLWIASNLPVGATQDSGIEYAQRGASTAVQVGPPGSSASSVGIAGGQLYAASTDQTTGGQAEIWQVGTGLPTTSGSGTLATLPGLQAAYQAAFPNKQDPKQFLFFNHLDGTSNNPDTLFVADQAHGLLKFWFDGTNWRLGDTSGRFGQKPVFGGGATGLTGYVFNPGPAAQFQLYVTGSNVQGQNPNQIDALLDTNAYNAGFASTSFTTLAFVGAVGGSPNGNENFAGLAFVPGTHHPAPPTAPTPSPSGTSGGVKTVPGTSAVSTRSVAGDGGARVVPGAWIVLPTVGTVAILTEAGSGVGAATPDAPTFAGDRAVGAGEAVQPAGRAAATTLAAADAAIPANLGGAVLITVVRASNAAGTGGTTASETAPLPVAGGDARFARVAVQTLAYGPGVDVVGSAGGPAFVVADGAKADAFWRLLLGAKGWRPLSPWSFGSDDEGSVGG